MIIKRYINTIVTNTAKKTFSLTTDRISDFIRDKEDHIQEYNPRQYDLATFQQETGKIAGELLKQTYSNTGSRIPYFKESKDGLIISSFNDSNIYESKRIQYIEYVGSKTDVDI
jgi:hypothetical protein